MSDKCWSHDPSSDMTLTSPGRKPSLETVTVVALVGASQVTQSGGRPFGGDHSFVHARDHGCVVSPGEDGAVDARCDRWP